MTRWAIMVRTNALVLPIRGAALAALLATAACGDKVPEGQVVARVNGVEVTRGELQMELSDANVPANVVDRVRPMALQQLIDRKLLVQTAEKQGLDKDADYVMAERRGAETLLAQKFLRNVIAGARQEPSEAEVSAYLDAHPGITRGREMLVFDQLRFRAPADPKQLAGLNAVQTMDQLIAFLQGKNIAFERSQAQADTATLPPEIVAKLGALKPGEPLVLLGGSIIAGNVVIGRRPIAVSEEQAVATAKREIVTERLQKLARQQQQALRADAKIEYAKGMAPPAKPAKPVTKTK